MSSVSVNLTHLIDIVPWMFEYKDGKTLVDLERGLKITCPGEFKLVAWVDADDTVGDRVFSVVMKFDCDDGMMEWMLRWA